MYCQSNTDHFSMIEEDKRQRQLALDATRSFIVQAPAGSGKTELLIQRFLTLLTRVNVPEEILAITFTKKAANEMRARVVKAIKQAETEPEPTSAHAKQTWLLAKQVLARDAQLSWHLIQNPNQLRIQTIDALCAFLTKQMPLLSHFGAQPDIAPDPTVLYREAVEEILSHLEESYAWSNDIAQLLTHLDNDLNKLHDLLINLLGRRDQWLQYVQHNPNDSALRNTLEHHLQLVIQDSLQRLHALFPSQHVPALLQLARFAGDHLALTQPDANLLTCRALTQLPDTDYHALRHWQGLANLLLTKSGQWRKKVDRDIGFPALTQLKNAVEKATHAEMRQTHQALIKVLQEHENLRLALAQTFELPKPCYDAAQWQVLKSLLHVLKMVAAQLRITFQQRGQIDFIENALAALTALGQEENPTDLCLALDYQIKHLLVDEFQDTSFTQYQLLEKLTMGWHADDGRTLFVVGDPMQSIYRFREAEVGLFIRMRTNGIGAIPLIPLTLAVNFRSASVIVAWNNTQFTQLFPKFNDMATGAVIYSPSVTLREEAVTNTHPPAITVQGYVNGSDEYQAAQIIHAIQQTQQSYPDDDIAILVRSRGHLASIIPALKAAQLRFRAVNIDSLATRQVIQDLMSLTCALLHPGDRIAWLALLRAPWCGLTLCDLYHIVNEEMQRPIWSQLSDVHTQSRLSDDGQQRLAKLIPVIRDALTLRERTPLRHWIERTWLLLGGPATLADENELQDAAAFFNLLDQLAQSGQALTIETLKDNIEALFSNNQDEHAKLHIMTIHAAKGLEFDTVILPQLERKNPSDDKSLFAWMERPLANDKNVIMMAPIHATGDEEELLYDYINKQQKLKTYYETDRLLYVATTRAKKRLHLFFNASEKADGDIKIESGSFLEKLWPALKAQRSTLLQHHTPPTAHSTHSTQRVIARLPTTWQNTVTLDISHRSSQQENLPAFELNQTRPRLVGTVIHRILQQLAECGDAWWQQQTTSEQQHYLTRLLCQAGVLMQDLPEAVIMAHEALERTLQDTRGRWILTSHHAAKAEYALTSVDNDTSQLLIIDRTFIDDQGIRWIIDYKTTTFHANELNLFLAQEQVKYLAKMTSYAQAMHRLEQRPIRMGLYFPALAAWKEWAWTPPAS